MKLEKNTFFIRPLVILSEFEKYRIVQDKLFKSDFNKLIEAANEANGIGKPL